MQSLSKQKLFEVVTMKLLCVLGLLVVITNDVIATSEAEFYGTWTLVEAFRNVNITIVDDDDYHCAKFKFDPGETMCTCNGVDLVTLNLSHIGRVTTRMTIPAFIADTQEEAFEFARRPCKTVCGGEFKVFRKLDDNYFILYFSTRSNKVPDAMLLAKSVPSMTDLDVVLNNLNELKDKVKVHFCNSDTNN